ncbi:MAG: hypothetical protein U0930_25890 [Pirellulales bacterium]
MHSSKTATILIGSQHAKHRDQTNVVIDNDGVLFPGDVVALRAASPAPNGAQNKSGGGVDPHAGHNH